MDTFTQGGDKIVVRRHFPKSGCLHLNHGMDMLVENLDMNYVVIVPVNLSSRNIGFICTSYKNYLEFSSGDKIVVKSL